MIEKLRHDIVWHLVVGTLRVLLLLPARVRVVFYGTFPERGGFILATNHVSHFDPPLITSHFPRRIDWIAVRELFGAGWSNWLFTNLNVIPVDRSGADRTALRTAVRRLQAGRVVGIFPEGGIRDGERSIVNGAAMRGGVGMLSSMAGAPVVPGVILGSERLYNVRRWRPWNRASVWIGYGSPIMAPEDLAGEERRSYVQTELAGAVRNITKRLCDDFQLTADDLPHSPQERMAEK